jgi:hypothetical protein
MRPISILLGLLLSAFVALSLPALSQGREEAPPERAWAVGIHANFPFLGISFRYRLSETMGIEINLAPIPTCEYEPVRLPKPEPDGDSEPPPPEVFEPERPECPNALELYLSARGLLKVSDNLRADFYVTAGPSLMLQFTRDKPMALERSMVAVLGEIEISNWPIERVYPVIDYGFAVNLQNLYDFRWIAGGIGFHFYF